MSRSPIEYRVRINETIVVLRYEYVDGEALWLIRPGEGEDAILLSSDGILKGTQWTDALYSFGGAAGQLKDDTARVDLELIITGGLEKSK